MKTAADATLGLGPVGLRPLTRPAVKVFPVLMLNAADLTSYYSAEEFDGGANIIVKDKTLALLLRQRGVE